MASAFSNITCHVKRNLACLKEMPRVCMFNIKNFDEARKKKQRKGRGPGSGRGKTCGRGHKGQGQRNTLPYLGFEGGQTPFYLSVPKHGRKSKNPKEITILHLSRLQYMADCGRLPTDEKLTIRRLLEIGAVSCVKKDGLRLLGGGAEWFQSKIDIEVNLASQSAIEAVEREGGKIKLVYHTQESLRAHVRPNDFPDAMRPKEASPTDNWRYFYSRADKRGYLADPELVEKERARNRTLKELSDGISHLHLEQSSDPSVTETK